MDTIDFYGVIHIKWLQTSKETTPGLNADGQCEWTLKQGSLSKQGLKGWDVPS